jgi:hypothetical protein
MADNTQLEQAQSPLGDIISTDDITDGGVADSAKVQRVKAGFGANNNYEDPNRDNPFPVDLGVESPQTTLDVALAVAAGSSVDLDSGQISVGTTAQLVGLIIASSVSVKATLKMTTNAADGPNLAVFFSQAGDTQPIRMPGKTFFTVAHDAGAGLDAIKVNVLNLDPTQAADIYVTFLYDEI